MSEIFRIKHEKYDQLGRSCLVVGGVWKTTKKKNIREEALVRLTNHRGNPVIFPLNLSGEFFFSPSILKGRRRRRKKMSRLQPLEFETTPTGQIIGPLLFFFVASILSVCSTPLKSEKSPYIIHSLEKSVCTKGARMSWKLVHTIGGPPKLIHIFITYA